MSTKFFDIDRKELATYFKNFDDMVAFVDLAFGGNILKKDAIEFWNDKYGEKLYIDNQITCENDLPLMAKIIEEHWSDDDTQSKSD